MQLYSIITSDNSMLFFSTMLGAIIGAAVGGYIQFKISKSERAANLEARKNEQAEMDKSLAYAVFGKILRIANQAHNIDILIKNSFAESEAKAPGLPLWLRLRPFIGLLHTTFEITGEETALFFKLNLTKEIGEFALLPGKLSSLIETCLRYSELRVEFTRP